MKYEILNMAGLTCYNGEADTFSEAQEVAEKYKESFPDDDFRVYLAEELW